MRVDVLDQRAGKILERNVGPVRFAHQSPAKPLGDGRQIVVAQSHTSLAISKAW
jgi:hypothetical protein